MSKRVKMLTAEWHRKQEHFIHPFRSFQCIRFAEKHFFFRKQRGCWEDFKTKLILGPSAI